MLPPPPPSRPCSPHTSLSPSTLLPSAFHSSRPLTLPRGAPVLAEQILGFSSLAIISFLPGFYASRIAYYSWRGRAGYNVHQIPSS